MGSSSDSISDSVCSESMKIYAISDTHFGHDKLVTLSNRPTDFTEKILKSLKFTEADLLIHCGDFCIGQDEHWHNEFHFACRNIKKKILVRGNHDGKSDSWYYNHGWDFVCTSFVHTFYGKTAIFTHIPILKTDKFDFNVHGHLHGNNHRHQDTYASLYDRTWHKDLAPEVHDYKPVSLEKLLCTPNTTPTTS